MRLIGNLGFKSGRDDDKLRLLKVKTGVTGAPIVMDSAVGYIEAELNESVDLGTHTLFIGKVIGSKVYNDEGLMTYEFYHDVKNGKSPETCPLFFESEVPDKENCPIVRDMSKYECIPCGDIYDPEVGDPFSGIPPGTPFVDLPDDWECPICGVGKDEFVKVREKVN